MVTERFLWKTTILRWQWKYSESCFPAVACVLLFNRSWLYGYTPKLQYEVTRTRPQRSGSLCFAILHKIQKSGTKTTVINIIMASTAGFCRNKSPVILGNTWFYLTNTPFFNPGGWSIPWYPPSELDRWRGNQGDWLKVLSYCVISKVTRRISLMVSPGSRISYYHYCFLMTDKNMLLWGLFETHQKCNKIIKYLSLLSINCIFSNIGRWKFQHFMQDENAHYSRVLIFIWYLPSGIQSAECCSLYILQDEVYQQQYLV